MKTKLFFILLFFKISVYGQSTVQPSMPINGGSWTNSVNFNFTTNVFEFNYQGADGNLKFKYNPNSNAGTGGTFNRLSCSINNGAEFQPSISGGFFLNNTPPWEVSSYTLLSATQVSPNVLQVKFKATHTTSSIMYTYNISISGRTLIIKTALQSGIVTGAILDRCDNAPNATVIHIPYLRNMNLLYTGGVFVSIYFDWETTNASTMNALDGKYSNTSVFYGQQIGYGLLTNNNRNPANETIYLTVSPSVSDVLPNIINPVSPNKTFSASHIVIDNWEEGFDKVNTQMKSLYNNGVNNLWVLLHNWQNGGYDNKLPNTLPANSILGGNAGVTAIAQTVKSHGDHFAVHENYVDFYQNAASWTVADASLNSDGSLIKAWFNQGTQVQSYLMKNSKVANYLTTFAPAIHTDCNTNSSFLDVHSSVNPSNHVDYDATVPNAGKFTEALKNYRAPGQLMRNAHQGPVSGEGDFHLYHVGYYDDICAGIGTAGNNTVRGYKCPMFVDFDLLKMHDKAAVHGMGYYERFFFDAPNGGFTSFAKPEVLEYMATELAFGHGAFVPTPGRVYDFVEVAQLEQKYILPAAKLYANANAVAITYDDNGQMIDVSQYIKNHPTTFDDITSVNFMTKVKIVYDNGTIVYVNRHPTQNWNVTPTIAPKWFNYHAIINGNDVMDIVASSPVTTWTLPSKSGWLVVSPIAQSLSVHEVNDGMNSLINLFPNPTKDLVTIKGLTIGDKIIITDLSGKTIFNTSAKQEDEVISTAGFTAGLYIVSVDRKTKLKLIKE
jgi:Family of unknown function (DUF5696)/Secretion system C-terminal sorting domain